MRIKSVQLEWFRGSADPIVLETGSKSTVAYGENGSGKSSFVDAIEFSIHNGKIGHLSHEQSGKRQEKAIPNIHTPADKKTGFAIRFADQTEQTVKIKRDGSFTKGGAQANLLDTWDYRSTVLRQDEVANFISNTKGEKYSALLPLLGLQHIEIAAENLRKLTKAIEHESKLGEIKGSIAAISSTRKEIFGEATDAQIEETIGKLHGKYCASNSSAAQSRIQCKELKQSLEKLIADFTVDQKRHLALLEISKAEIKANLESVSSSAIALAQNAEPLISEKLQVLSSANVFASKLTDEETVQCPACGKDIEAQAFKTHLQDEKMRLQEITKTFDSYRSAINTLCDSLAQIKRGLSKTELTQWRIEQGQLKESFSWIENLGIENYRKNLTPSDIQGIENFLLPIIDAATVSSQDAPAEVGELSAALTMVEAATSIEEAKENVARLADIAFLIALVRKLEEEVREEIRDQSQAVITAITKDIQMMWEILHPNEHIEEVRLHVPPDTDKAIDICLKFHGVDQDSPRLTLSEGFRNSLGLCIFLAMAIRGAEKDRPIFLDDVVVSVDRNHRGMIVELLEKLFSGRQLILLTHDRDWFVELKQQLNNSNWTFQALMPYETPALGIRWSAKSYGFDDARAFLQDSPASAGNTARKIMDIELALRAEKLKIRLPYLHRERNDHRVAHEFLAKFISDGERSLQKKSTEGYTPNIDSLDKLKAADTLLISWGNKASHTLDVTKSEAAKLIDVCEAALGVFNCEDCEKPIHKLEDSAAQAVQCGCGNHRWRYGKSK